MRAEKRVRESKGEAGRLTRLHLVCYPALGERGAGKNGKTRKGDEKEVQVMRGRTHNSVHRAIKGGRRAQLTSKSVAVLF